MRTRTYVTATERPDYNLLNLDRHNRDAGDLRGARALAQRMKDKSLFAIRGEIEDSFRNVCKRNLAEAQCLVIKLQAIARGQR